MADAALSYTAHTPEPVNASRYAGFWVRFFSACIDLAWYPPIYYGLKILFDFALHNYVAAGSLAGAPSATDYTGGQASPSDLHPWWFETVFAVVLLFSYAWFFSSKWQASPGMYLCKFHICDVEGNRISYARALWWGVTSMAGMLFCLAGVIYLMSRFDLNAVKDLSLSCLQENVAQEDCRAEIEQVIGIPYNDYQTLIFSAVGMALFLLLIWALSIALPKDKTGFHNIFCGTRFVKGRA